MAENGQVTGAIAVAISGVAVALIGYVATYVNSIRMSQRQAKLDRVNRQLSEFYGPLLAISSASSKAWDIYKQYRSDQGLHESTAESEFDDWERWVTSVFMPGNRRLREVIISKADLLIDDNLPACLTAFCAHVSGWEVSLRRWNDGDHSIKGSVIPFPAELHEYAQTSFLALKQEQMRLLGEKATPPEHADHRLTRRSSYVR